MGCREAKTHFLLLDNEVISRPTLHIMSTFPLLLDNEVIARPTLHIMSTFRLLLDNEVIARPTLHNKSTFPLLSPRSGELRTQKLKSHLVRTQSLSVLPLKPGVGQYIAIHATLTARDFFLAYFYPPGSFTCSFSKTSPDFSCVRCG